LALLLRCFDATYNTYNLFDAVQLGNPEHISLVMLPSTCISVDDAKDLLSAVASTFKSCVIIGYPTATSFQVYIMLLVRCSDNNANLNPNNDQNVGIQAKLGCRYPNIGSQAPTEKCTGGSFWIRGDASMKSNVPRIKDQLIRFLGHSLGELYPAKWQ